MKDFLGNELAVGDAVVITCYSRSGLERGVVEKINPKTAQVRTSPGDWGVHRKGSEYIIKIQGGTQ